MNPIILRIKYRVCQKNVYSNFLIPGHEYVPLGNLAIFDSFRSLKCLISLILTAPILQLYMYLNVFWYLYFECLFQKWVVRSYHVAAAAYRSVQG